MKYLLIGIGGFLGADLLRTLASPLADKRGATVSLAKYSAVDVMTPDPITVRPDTPLPDALRLLLAHKVKRLPVVDAEGRLVGLVGRGEILQALARTL